MNVLGNSNGFSPRRILHPEKRGKDEAKIVLNYRFEEVVGYGNWGKVRRGWDLGNERPVAIKILRKKRVARKIRDGVSKLYKEFSLLKGLHHEGVVEYYDMIETDYPNCSESWDSSPTTSKSSSVPSSPSSLSSFQSTDLKDGKIYLMMEWLGDGCNLSRWLQAPHSNYESKMSHVRLILRKLLESLEYLRNQQVIHHDIKLDNIIFDESSGKVTLIDFGVSEVCLQADECYSSHGTPAYQAPEIVSRPDPLAPISGHKSDIWSLGVVAYQLCNGHCPGGLPFEDDTIYAVFETILHVQPDFRVIEDSAARDLISKLLCKDPSKRPTASEALKHPFFGKLEDASEFSFSKVFKRLLFSCK